MHLRSLYINNYRNLAEQTIEFAQGVNFIIGQNAQGKTNILESIAYLATGKSICGAKNSELINFNAEEAYVKCIINTQITEQEIGITIKKKSREIRVADKKVSGIADLIGNLLCISFIPKDLEIIRGEPSIRRKFIDSHLSLLNKNYLINLVKYNSALKNKNFLLKNHCNDPNKINTWNQILAETAEKLYFDKQEFVQILNEKIKIVFKYFAELDGELELKIENPLLLENPNGTKDLIYEQLISDFQKEQILRRAINGPHKDDLTVMLNGHLARNFASQGQTRSLSLALKFSMVELVEEQYEDSPVILLDDLDSELDSIRASKLFELIFSKERQIIITGTELREGRIANNHLKNLKTHQISVGKIT